MSATANISALHSTSVIADVLPPATASQLRGALEITYPSGHAVVHGGEEVDREATQAQPEVVYKGADEDTSALYTIIMTDPDLLKTNDTMSGQVRHWLQPGVRFHTVTGKAEFTEPPVTSYLGCAPGMGTGKHRYVFILGKQSPSFSPSPQSSVLIAGGVDADLKSRVSFDATKYIEETGLEVVAATVMFVAPNISSTLADVKMMAESLGNTAVGK